jgi:hypothetical protein
MLPERLVTDRARAVRRAEHMTATVARPDGSAR